MRVVRQPDPETKIQNAFLKMLHFDFIHFNNETVCEVDCSLELLASSLHTAKKTAW